MKGFLSNLRYWWRIAELMFLQILLVLIIFACIEGIESPDRILALICRNSLSYFPMLSIFILCIFGFSNINTYLPISLAMGSTRKSAFLAMEAMMLILEMQMYLFAMAAGSIGKRLGGEELVPQSITRYALPYLIIPFIALCFYHIVGFASLKFNRTVGFLIYFVCAFGGMLGGALFMLPSYKATVLQLFDWPYLLPLAIIAALATMVMYYQPIKKMEVKV